MSVESDSPRKPPAAASRQVARGADDSGSPPAAGPAGGGARASESADEPHHEEAGESPFAKKKHKDKKKKKSDDAGRGVETMFRTSYRTHLDLSSLADTKANIMITINGIMISILLATIYPSIAANRMLLLPSSVLLLGCLASVVYAVLAARPRVTRRKLGLADVRENRANILFFGTFASMSEEDFLTGMWELMEDRRRTYTNMMRDLYGLGAVLETKYRLLRVSYTVFMLGLVAGVLLFLAVYGTAGGQVGGG